MASLDLTILQNAGFSQTVQLCDEEEAALDLTGCEVAAQVRSSFSAASTLVDFSVDGSIDIDSEEGKITLSLDEDFTSTLRSGGVWDMLVEWPEEDEPRRVLEGRVRISPGVTKVPEDWS